MQQTTTHTFFDDGENFFVKNHLTGEVWQAKDRVILIRELAKDHGFYLRPIKKGVK